jgi:hypothetical protein
MVWHTTGRRILWRHDGFEMNVLRNASVEWACAKKIQIEFGNYWPDLRHYTVFRSSRHVAVMFLRIMG